MTLFSRILLGAFIALISVAALAKDQESYNITLHSKAVIAGANLAAGDYKIVIDRAGNTAKVTFLQYKTKVATADASIAPLPAGITNLAVVTNAKGDLLQIQIAKMNGTLVFQAADKATAGTGQ